MPEGRSEPDTATRLSEILCESLTALAAAGQPDEACRQAARACMALRKHDPRNWRRFNALLHRLSPKSGPVEASQPLAPPAQEAVGKPRLLGVNGNVGPDPHPR